MPPHHIAALNFLQKNGAIQIGLDRQLVMGPGFVWGKERRVVRGPTSQYPDEGLFVWLPVEVFTDPQTAIIWFLGRNA